MNSVDKEFEKLIQDYMDRDAERIMAEVNSDPSLRDVVAPKEIEDRLFEQIAEFRTRHSRRNAEEEELIRLGRKYKKNYKRNRVLVAILAAVCGLSVGVTCLGGPERIAKKVEGMLEGIEQTNVDTDGERTEGVQTITEDLAYRQIEEKFNFYPVRLDYIPENMEFYEVTIDENLHKIQLVYYKDGRTLSYTIFPNYRTGSASADVEDNFLDEYAVQLKGVQVLVKQYQVEGGQTDRWRATFEYKGVQYALMSNGIEEAEFIKIIENLYFS